MDIFFNFNNAALDILKNLWEMTTKKISWLEANILYKSLTKADFAIIIINVD